MPDRESLTKEIATLEGRLLTDFTTDFPEVPSLEEAILINAYLVLAHGCVEEYLEALFQEYADDLASPPDPTTVTRAVAMAAFAWQDEAKSKKYEERSLDDILKSGSSKVQKAIQANHGIKEANIRQLAKAAGVEWPSFDSSCNFAFTRLDTLGGKRGSVAHVSTSSTQITSRPVYPPEAKRWVADALDATQLIDDYLTTVKRPLSQPLSP